MTTTPQDWSDWTRTGAQDKWITGSKDCLVRWREHFLAGLLHRFYRGHHNDTAGLFSGEPDFAADL